MAKRPTVMIDGNEAAAHSAYLTNEVISIYPITPASPMGEHADAWAANGRPNAWGSVPEVVEMQSEGGAAGACHGSLQAGALTTTFTASQGLLLMLPNLFKIAGELTPTVFHIAARTVATHALSIFADHSDVLSARGTGWALLSSASVQEAQDFAMIAQMASLESRVPFLHFFDGFRTSHELNKIELLTAEDARELIDEELVAAHRERAMSPDKPVLRGTAQNPDVFFQARESCNPFYDAVPEITQKAMDRFAKLVGRQYKLFEYFGHPEADHVIMLMGSGVGTAIETVEALAAQGEKVGVLAVRLYRPFSVSHMLNALPKNLKVLTVLDRTKEPGAHSEPMHLDAVNAIVEAWEETHGTAMPKVVGGRFGLSSKEFTPAMIKGVFDNMKAEKVRNHFTVGINDDLTHLNLNWDSGFITEPDEVTRAMFYGLGSDGTVGANKNSIKIIGLNTPLYAQGYFVYDSKKAGSVTISHLRFGPKPITSTYLIQSANFIACHQFNFLEKMDMLANAKTGATFLLNSPYGPDEVWEHIPVETQREIIEKEIKLFVIDGAKVAAEAQMGFRINTVMQTCFFKLSGILPEDEAIAKIKEAIAKTYGKRGEIIVKRNYAAVDGALANLHQVKVPTEATGKLERVAFNAEGAPEYVTEVMSQIMAAKGDDVPVSAFLPDGSFPTATTQWEKRSIAREIPIWDEDVCTACGFCSIACPHAAILMKTLDAETAAKAPESFKTRPWKGKDFPEGTLLTIQVAPDDCTGCGVCVDVCPAKNKAAAGRKAINMEYKLDHLERERVNYDHFLTLPWPDRSELKTSTVKGSQLLQPLFEFSGACAGCGETPYVKLISQLFGDRMVIANATGCSSIYGGNLPSTPFTVNSEGRGPTWNNSLFEDNAEFGLGMRLALDKQQEFARELVKDLAGEIGDLADQILEAPQTCDAEYDKVREMVATLKTKVEKMEGLKAKQLLAVADSLVERSMWIVGGDGWAYDIGYGGLDHVLAAGRNVNILVLDTEVYSNTGGQASKATPRGAVAKFAAKGKPGGKKDLGQFAMAYGNVYVGQIALGASQKQAIKAFQEAEAYPGTSIIIAYSTCIAHGINMTTSQTHMKEATQAGFWPLFRYLPGAEDGKPFKLDSRAPKMSFKEFALKETRFSSLARSRPEEAERLFALAQQDIDERWRYYEQLAELQRAVPKV